MYFNNYINKIYLSKASEYNILILDNIKYLSRGVNLAAFLGLLSASP